MINKVELESIQRQVLSADDHKLREFICKLVERVFTIEDNTDKLNYNQVLMARALNESGVATVVQVTDPSEVPETSEA